MRIPVQRVPAERLDRLTRKNHQGGDRFLCRRLPTRAWKISFLLCMSKEKDPFIVLMDGVTDVRNFGAIARTCECAGVDAIVIPAKEAFR